MVIFRWLKSIGIFNLINESSTCIKMSDYLDEVMKH